MTTAHKFTNDLGQETIVLDGVQIEVVTDLAALCVDNLYWFEGEQLVIGNRRNAADVTAREKWLAEMGCAKEE